MNKVLLEIIQNMQHHKIMVIGDMVADIYLEGKISRISREAPVLVLEHQAEKVVPGGAANAVHNAGTLGGDVFAVGVIGDDYAGRQLTGILHEKSINTVGLIVDQARPTITKTRVMAGGLATVRQQVVRIDRESKAVISPVVEGKILAYLKVNLNQMAVVVMSDYGSQAISPAIRQLVISTCKLHAIPCIVDSRYDILAYNGVTMVKQNESEVAAALGYSELNQSNLTTAGFTLLDRLAAQAILLTRGPEGISLFELGNQETHIPVTNLSEVYDVTGAGDTAVVAAALALAAGANFKEAARLANIAAGVVIRKLGAATTTPAELKEAIGSLC